MIDRPWAERFALEWAASWQSKDLDVLLSHYSPSVVFRSPRISAVLEKHQASVSDLPKLRAYWNRALEAAKEVRFEIAGIGLGNNALTILYRNQRDDQVAETLVFDENGKIVEGIVTYVKPLET